MTSIGGSWNATHDPNSGRYYYFNEQSQETSWDWPDAEVPKPRQGAGGWEAADDPTSGRVYYYHTDGSTDWAVPDEIVAKIVADGGVGVSAEGGEAAASQGGGGGGGGAQSAMEALAAGKIEDAVAALTAVSAIDAEEEERERLAAEEAAKVRAAELWSALLPILHEEADMVVQSTRRRFERLRRVRAQRKKEEEEQAEAEAAAAAAEQAQFAAEHARLRELTIVGMLKLPVPEAEEERTMEEYAEENLDLNRKGLFNGRTTVQKILHWKDELIKKPLKRMLDPANAREDSLQLFRNITGYMGDRSSTKGGGGHAEKMLKLLMSQAEEMRDEAYVQLIKQTTNNKSKAPNSLINGWQLFAVLTGSVMPSPEFLPYLRYYFFQTMQNTEAVDDGGSPGVHEYASACLARVAKLVKMRPRTEVPPGLEIESAKLLQPALVRLFLVDGSYRMLPIHSFTTATDLKNMMTELLGIRPSNARGLAVYEMTDKLEERCLDDDERICDVLAYWQRIFDEAKQKAGKKAHQEEQPYKLVLKVQHYYAPKHQPKRDKAADRFLYNQAVFDVVCDRYPCIDTDCVKLAAFQRQAEKPNTNVAKKELGRYLKKSYIESKGEEYRAQINTELAKLSGKSPAECRRLYVQYVQGWKIYGSSFFPASPTDTNRFGDFVFVAINPQGVMIIDPDTKAAVAEFPYRRIPTWGHSRSSFVLHVGNLVKPEKLYFQTHQLEQGAYMGKLVRAYVNEQAALAGATVTDQSPDGEAIAGVASGGAAPA